MSERRESPDHPGILEVFGPRASAPEFEWFFRDYVEHFYPKEPEKQADLLKRAGIKP